MGSTDFRLPYLEIDGPDGYRNEIELSDQRLTIGRLPNYNDLSLQPDPQRLVSRVGHCAVERDRAGWWVVDNASMNRTYIEHDHNLEIVNGRAPLNDGAIIHILARLPDDGEQDAPHYWSLTFRDPMRTQPVSDLPRHAHVEYDWLQARLFLIDDRRNVEISDLRPQEHLLIRYMDQRNRSNNYVPVMCTTEELIEALWGEEAHVHVESEIAKLVWSIRKKIESEGGDPQILQTVRGLGYRLTTRPRPGQ